MRAMRHNQVLFDTEWADGLLTVKGELKVEQAPVPGVACAVTASTWHNRFGHVAEGTLARICLLYTSPSPRDATLSRMPSSA